MGLFGKKKKGQVALSAGTTVPSAAPHQAAPQTMGAQYAAQEPRSEVPAAALAALAAPAPQQPRRVPWQEQVADEEALRALRAASPELQESWEGDNPSEWWGVKWGDGHVRELDLRGCPLKELPAQVGLLTGLTTLNLISCFQLTALPAELGLLTGLTTLDLAGCKQLKALPAELGQLVNLTSLSLISCFQLTALPAELGLLTGLTKLDLNNCEQLTALPTELGLLIGLTLLNLMNCMQLTALPAELGLLTGLTTLYLNNCEQLTALPAELGLLIGLTLLDLYGCTQLKELPAELGQLVNLTTLDIRDCEQLTLPPGAPANAKETTSAPPIIAAYARLLIVEPRKDTPGQLHAFLLATPLAVPPFFKYILTDETHAVWLGKAVGATPDLARLTHPDGRRAIDVAVPACKQQMQAALYLLARYDVDDGPLLHRSATAAVAAADDHADPEAKPVPRVALKAMRKPEQVLAELQGRVGLRPEHVISIKAVFVDEAVDAEAWKLIKGAASELEVQAVAVAPGLSTLLQVHLFPAKRAEPGKLQKQGSMTAINTSGYSFLLVLELADRSLSHTIIHEHIAGKDWAAIRYIATDLVQALAHMHAEGLIHADGKPLNAVRAGLTWKLIDLDVSCKIDQPFGNKVPSSGYCPPEFARVLLKATDDQGKVDGAKLAECVASVAYDLWSFGTVLYHLIFGRSFWNNDVDDNVTPADLRKLAAVPDTPLRRALDAKLSDGEGRNANVDLRVATALLRKLLEPDAQKRMAHFPRGVIQALEEPFFQMGANLDAPTLQQGANLDPPALQQVLAGQKEINLKLDNAAENQEKVIEKLETIMQSLTKYDAKLTNLIKGDHKVRFRYFVLEPKPLKPYTFAKFKSKVWLTEPMLLIPLYLDEDKNLQKAPVNKEALGGHEGFEIEKPKDFVQAHPLLIKASLFVMKIALTAAAAQVGVRIPQFKVDFSGGGGIETMLQETMKDVVNKAVQKGIAVSSTTGAVSGEVADRINSLEAPEAGLEQMLTPDGDAGHGLTNAKYMSLASWLDEKHPGWQDNLGLKIEEQGDGTLNIVPTKQGSAQAQEASRTAIVQVDERDVENERLKKENEELKKEIAKVKNKTATPTAPTPAPVEAAVGAATQALAQAQQEASRTADAAFVQVNVENERLKKEIDVLKKGIAEARPEAASEPAPRPKNSCCVIG